MSNRDKAYGGAAGPYAAAIKYGSESLAGRVSESPAMVKDVTSASFSTDVIQESRKQPVMVDFWAPRAAVSKQLTPTLEKVVKAAKGKVRLVRMNIDEHPAIAGQLGIQSIPTVIAFKNGQPIDGFVGAVPESQIKEFIDRIGGPGLGPQAAETLAAAVQARDAGDLESAAALFDAVLAEEPENVDALGGLADILFESGDRVGAEEVLAQVPHARRDAPPLAAVRARMALADQTAGLGDPAEFERRLAADPLDHQARFDLAILQNAMGKRTEAADSLLAIVKADRSWKEDGARAQLLQFFEAWGLMDGVTLATRRKLSSLLFS